MLCPTTFEAYGKVIACSESSSFWRCDMQWVPQHATLLYYREEELTRTWYCCPRPQVGSSTVRIHMTALALRFLANLSTTSFCTPPPLVCVCSSATLRRQEWACANAESPVLMEMDAHLRAQDVGILVYRPTSEQCAGKSTGPRVHDSSGDDDDAPESESLRKQHSGGSVSVGDGEEELSTHEAIKRRDALHLPALAAATTIEVGRLCEQYGVCREAGTR